MALCPECERTGTDRPAREPVLVGDVLAGLAGALTRADAPTLPAQRRRHVRQAP
ncbi:hypothetical protein ACWDNT_08910 [Streptomyces sp. NPDC000963]|uniref:hypothetical protein n=1 Tax=unclassified Streptomyces TaxID=2593676 RepID=UPI0034198284